MSTFIANCGLLGSPYIDPSGGLFSDNFDDNTQDLTLWDKTSYLTNDPLVTVVEGSSKVTITPRASFVGSAWNGYQSVNTFSLIGKSIEIEAQSVTNTSPGSSISTEFGVILDATNYAAFSKTPTGNLSYTRVTAGSSSFDFETYNSTTHRWWRLTEKSGNIIWETSPDGVAWSRRHTLASSFSLSAIKIYFLAGTGSSVASPGTAQFDNFSGYLIQAGAIHKDDFNDETQSTIWDKTAYSSHNPLVTVTETVGKAVITRLPSTAGTNRNGYQTVNTYNFTNKYAQIECDPGSTVASVLSRYHLLLDNSNLAQFIIGNGGNITFRHTVAGTPTDTTITYDSTNHRWLRFEHDGTNLLWRTSPNGATWTTRKTVATPFAITALKVGFLGETAASIGTPGQASFDTFVSNLS